MAENDWPIVAINDNGIRPAGPPDACLYCRQKVGTPHGRDCVVVEKRIKVRYTFEVEINVPYAWDAATVEFHRNDGTWCANNAIEEIEAMSPSDDDCLCQHFKCEFVEVVDATPTRELDSPEDVHQARAWREAIGAHQDSEQ